MCSVIPILMQFLKQYIQIVECFNSKVGIFASWLTFLLVITVVIDVFSRYFLQQSSVAIQELEWHLFAAIFLLGAAHTLKKNEHVRVDLIFSKFSLSTQAWINILGTLLFLMPFSIVVMIASDDFVLNSFSYGEKSPDPGGLPARYILKAILPISFVFIFLQGVALLFKSILTIINEKGNQQ